MCWTPPESPLWFWLQATGHFEIPEATLLGLELHILRYNYGCSFRSGIYKKHAQVNTMKYIMYRGREGWGGGEGFR